MQDPRSSTAEDATTAPARPPVHVSAAFGADDETGRRLPGISRRGWRYGDLVLHPAPDAVLAGWASGVFESLRVREIRVARPVRSLDGRWVVGGWRAERFLSGRPGARHIDVIAVARYLDEALAATPAPRFVLDREGFLGRLDRLTWGAEEAPADGWGDGALADLWLELAAGRRPIDAARQVMHADLFGNVLFAGSAPPAALGFAPLARPAGFSAALVVVDAVAWAGAPPSLALELRADPHAAELLRRACLFRLAMTLLHPRATEAARTGLASAIGSLQPFLR